MGLSAQETEQVDQVLTPSLALSPDEGFPVWLTPDTENYLPLVAHQTSGLDWIGCEDGVTDWLIAIDDIDNGRIHLLAIDDDNEIEISFKNNSLTLPPPEISGLNVNSGNGYDFEAIAYHPWSDSIFLSHEGSISEIGIYHGKVSYRPCDENTGEIVTKSDDTINRPEYISSPILLELPGWDEVFGPYVGDNLGIEGMAVTEDRLFLGLESPFSFTERLLNEKSTIIAIWKIDPENPSDMGSCELLAVHDTSEWKDTYGYTIETVCGLDAIDSNHLIGIDRDSKKLFTSEFDNEGGFIGGRWIYLGTPGPAVLPEDGCEQVGYEPDLLRPSLESVCLVPAEEDPYYPDVPVYHIYVACDPWGPGWAISEPDWECEAYERRLESFLPALYRYTVSMDLLFPTEN